MNSAPTAPGRGLAPRLARLILRLVPEPHRGILLGDLLEEYADSILPAKGGLRAGGWLLAQALRTVVVLVLRPPASNAPRLGGALPDARVALRSLVRRPGFSFLAVTTLAVGVGAVTVVFGILDWALLRPAPGIREPAGVVAITFRSDGHAVPVSFLDIRDAAAASPGLVGVAGQTNLVIQVGAEGVRPVEVVGEAVTADYFGLLGVRPELGRLLGPGDDATPGVVVSHGFWNRHLGGGLGAVGSTLRLNGIPFTVIGVADREFRGSGRVGSIELWVPLERYAELRHVPTTLRWDLDNRGAAIVRSILGRRAPGATPEAVESQLRAASVRLVEEHGDEGSIAEGYLPAVTRGAGLDPALRGAVTAATPAFAWAAAMVLLIACANVAGLLLLRGARRKGELALRRALGAERWNLWTQHLVETAILAVPAVLIGLALAWWMGRIVWSVGLVPALWSTGYWSPGATPAMPFDPRVAAFAAGASLLAALAAGTIPAVIATRAGIASPLKSSQTTTVGRLEGAAGSALIVAQLALSLALLTGTLLLARSLHNLRGVDLGFTAAGVSIWSIDPGPQGYSLADSWTLHREVARCIALDGAESTLAAYGPFSGTVGVVDVGASPGEAEPRPSYADWVAPDYFEVLRMPLRRGRALRPGDEDAVVLSEGMARRLFGEESPIGRAVRVRGFGGESVRRVVGEVGDLAGWDRRDAAPGTVYLPLEGAPVARATLFVRGAIPPARLDRIVADAASDLDPAIPVPRAASMSSLVERSLSRDVGLARLMRLLAILATLLSGVGLYSIVAWVGRGRLREFGVRVALGARPGGIAGLVLRPALTMGAIGTALGIACSAVVARVLGSRLFGVSSLDPVSFGVAAAGLALVVLVAAMVPALRATRADPVAVLRAE